MQKEPQQVFVCLFVLPALERTTWRTETESFLGHGKTGRNVGDCLLLADLFFFELRRKKTTQQKEPQLKVTPLEMKMED